MGKKAKKRATPEEILADLADTMFPGDWPNTRKIDVESRDCDGDTPLHKAVWQGNRHAVRLLIEAGVDLDAQGDMGETALHGALHKGDAEIIAMILAAGADPHIRSEFGSTAWEEAERLGGPILRLFRERGG